MDQELFNQDLAIEIQDSNRFALGEPSQEGAINITWESFKELLNTIFTNLEKFDVLSSDPVSPVDNQVWFNSTSGQLKIYHNLTIKILPFRSELNNYQGVATPSTNPGTPDGPVFYLASDIGTYTNFSGVKISTDGVYVISNITGSWVLTNIFDISDYNYPEQLTLSQGAPYEPSFTNMLHSGVLETANYDTIKVGLSDYSDFKFRYVGSDTSSPTGVTPATAYYTADTVLTDATVLAKAYIWVQVLRISGGSITPSDVDLTLFLDINRGFETISQNITTINETLSTLTPTELDHINLIPDNALQSNIDYWNDMPIYGKNNVTLTKFLFPNVFSNYSLKGLANHATTSSNWFGAYHDITGVMAEGDTLVFRGYVYPTTSGVYIERRFRDSLNASIQTFTNISLTANQWNEVEFELTVPANAVYFGCLVRNFAQNQIAYLAGWDIHKKSTSGIFPKINNPETNTDSVVNTIFVNGATGNDANDGSSSSPVQTISQAITLLSGVKKARIVVAEGTYRETVNLSSYTQNDIEIVAKVNQIVKVMGSTVISSWSLTAGKTKVYEAALSATINVSKPVIFENGRESLPILESERHALQKSNTNRLPYSKLEAIAFTTDLATTLTNLESTAGKYYHDTGNNKIYIHPTDSDNPGSNGYTYEYSSRAGITPPAAISTSKLALRNIIFMFSNTYGIDLSTFGNVERNFVSVFGAANNGIQEASTITVAYNDEVADSRDGIAGTNDIESDNRARSSITYIGAWSHDNTDDGTSHHSKSTIKTIGCLFEYNGKSGIAPSNTCQWIDISSICRKNGGNPSYPNYGEGVEIINPVLEGDSGIGCTFTGIGTVCEENRVGFSVKGSSTTKAQLYNCISMENTFAEYEADYGTINAQDCKVYNTDSLKYKVTSNGGTINVKNNISLT